MLLVCFLLALTTAVKADAGACDRQLLSRKLAWAGEVGAWTPSGEELVLVDVAGKDAVKYTATGRLLGPLNPSLEHRPDFIPASVRFQGSQGVEGPAGVVEFSAGKFVELDAQGRQVGEPVDILAATSMRPGMRVDFVHQWALAGGDLVALVDLLDADEPSDDPRDWRSTFVRIPLGDPERFVELRGRDVGALVHDSPARIYYRLEYPQMAAIGETAYVLWLEEPVRILRNEKGTGLLEPLALDSSFLADFRNLPVIGHFGNFSRDFRIMMEDLETATVPIALHAWGDRLFVLSRAPSGSGTTEWKLTKIDPQRGAVEGTAVLPTTANHLTVVPGPKHWALVERGRVEDFYIQDISSIVTIPAGRFQGTLRGALCE